MMDDNFIIEYNNKKYKLEQLIQEENEYLGKLDKLPPIGFGKILVTISSKNPSGYTTTICYQKYEALVEKVSHARYLSKEAFKKLHKGPLQWSSGYRGQLLQRSLYLIQSVLTYQSCLDNLLQIIWFQYIIKEDITNRKDYLRLLKACSYLVIKKKKSSLPSDVKELISDFEKLFNHKSVKDIRDTANNYKHHANLNFSGLEEIDYGIEIKFNNGLKNIDLKEDIIDIDEYCTKLIDVNNLIVEFSMKLWNKLDYGQFVTRTEKGYSATI
ncbi:hypothetical protein [Elizabethkingia anophelis]|uniref:hypothetical protein n=2 Tax=Elizabethkingia anophelis TaxID=1117645 RepID=UPI000442B7E2|nr:hypothetical protein [Elizabethkingia anophelis]MCT3981421.1 hypothetical protein [Elizabethkingia anophelis]MCW2466251.1 hypothetical protein [Elizabethkingia anophelis]MDV3662151.1 hypothetical protein [Elizabethkingia anophelis]MDV4015227.1 hypothetical protein [Elizabethkingia anophelis]MVW84233.1 hypothetical protein [Elizabethkingia anophelis]